MNKKKPKIIIVEDEWIIANDIKANIEKLGYHVPLILSSGEEAIEKAKSDSPDMFIMDIALQGNLDGTEAAKLISSQFDIPIVFLTAYTNKKVLEKVKDTAAYGYLVKPFNEKELETTIDLALSKHKREIKEKKYLEQLERIANDRSIKLKLFSDIAEKSPLGIQILDTEGYIMYSNSALEFIYEYNRTELTGKNINELSTDPVFFEKVVFSSINKTGKWDGELVIKNKSGKTIPVGLAAFTVIDDSGQTAGTIGIIRDLTERKEAEDALKESEAKYRKLIETANDAILIADADTGIIIDANIKSEELFGIPVSNIIGMHQAELHPADEAEKYKNIFDDHVQAGQKITTDLYIVHKTGKTTPVDISASIAVIGGKKVLQGAFRDITEHKLAEEELKKHRDNLEELVNERTADLIRTNEELEEEISERTKIEKKLLDYQKQLQSLTSQISLIEENEKRRIASELHDCLGQNLALTKIKLGQLNKSAPSGEFKNDIREILLIIEQAITETRTLTFELSPPILYELGLSQAIRWLIDQFREKHGLEICLKDDGHEKPFDNSIRLFLFQAVRELLVNTVKHAKADSARIEMRKDNNKLQITIEDNGIGFPGPSVNYNGYGLFNIRERMNHISGHFEIKSRPGRGTRVILLAPFKIKNNSQKKD
ncbi:MAG: PAS domain S-box protein [Nitrospirota bacterium]